MGSQLQLVALQVGLGRIGEETVDAVENVAEQTRKDFLDVAVVVLRHRVVADGGGRRRRCNPPGARSRLPGYDRHPRRPSAGRHRRCWGVRPRGGGAGGRW